MHIDLIGLIAAAAAPANVSEWIDTYGKMLVEGIWGTIYMTMVSTIIGYLITNVFFPGYFASFIQ